MMIKFTIQSLRLQNFKGCKDFTLSANGKNMRIEGENASGKTTLFDAFCWILTGKDSLGNSQFDIIPRDNNHNQIKKLDTLVELVITKEENGKSKTFVLQKILQEKWSRPRGQEEEVYCGTTATYIVNGDSVTKTVYNKLISNEIVADEKVFKLLTNIRYFTEHLNCKERRDLLFSLVQDKIKDKEIIKSQERFAPISLVAHRESFETEAKRAIKELQQKQSETSAKIEENKRLLVDSETKADITTMRKVLESGEKELTEIRKLLSIKEYDIATIENASEVEEKRKKEEWEWDKRERLAKMFTYRNQTHAELDACKEALFQNQLYEQETELKALRKVVVNKKTELKNYKPSTHCPTCFQIIPPDQTDRAEEEFKKQCNHEIAEITKKGRRLAEQVKQTKKVHDELNSNRGKIETRLKEIDEAIEGIKSEEYKDNAFNGKGSDDNKKQQDLVKAIVEQKVLVERKEKALQPVRDEIAKQESRLGIQQRIAYLAEEYRKTGQQIILLERQIDLFKQFKIEKNKRITDTINSMFKICKFELIETTQEGIEKETCTTLVNGQRYETNANNADRIKAGIEISEVFSKYFGITLPLWIDNAESITNIQDTDAQQIRLVVAQGVNKLSVTELDDSKQESLF